MNTLQIVGRRSSLFTRVALLFAEELALEYEFVPIYDMLSLGPATYGDNPALKLPILRSADSTLFGAQNICRALAERSSGKHQIVWPEDLRDDTSRNAQELVWHCMAAQVQFVMGVVLGKLPAENSFFVKAIQGLEGSLRWLDSHVTEIVSELPAKRTVSLFEVSLFCLFEHLIFRPTVPVSRYPALRNFAHHFAQRAAAERTAYRFDVRPES